MAKYKSFSENITTGARVSKSGARGRSVESFAVNAWEDDENLVQAVMIEFVCTHSKARDLLQTLRKAPERVAVENRTKLYKVVKEGLCGGSS